MSDAGEGHDGEIAYGLSDDDCPRAGSWKGDVFVEEELGTKVKLWKRVQLDSGYQNTYAFGARSPLTPVVCSYLHTCSVYLSP
mmetsp:Transcript_15657/g.26075  ORF Transcript_15657/g.26075 Transcript_15657/m.26075 type:complete len:83 (+) Transcript_15657:181-429(+)